MAEIIELGAGNKVGPFGAARSRMIQIGDVIEFLIASHPGRTDLEISTAICGSDRCRSLVNAECRRFERAGKIERRWGTYAIANWPGNLNAVRSRRSRNVVAVY